MKHQKALWFSGKYSSQILGVVFDLLFDFMASDFVQLVCLGLRGAMAFALALQSKHDLAPGPGRTIFTTTTAIVILTVRVCSTCCAVYR